MVKLQKVGFYEYEFTMSPEPLNLKTNGLVTNWGKLGKIGECHLLFS